MQQDRPSRPTRRDARKERRASSKHMALIAEIGEPDIARVAASGQPQASRPSLRSGNLSRRVRTSLYACLAVLGGRTAGALSRRLHLGGGTSIAGVVAQRLYPDIIAHLSHQLQQGSILVTGTNGKTTTSGFIAAILRDAGLRVWRNREGSNLLRGIAGALVIRTRLNGRLRRAGQAISIFEADEAVLPQAVGVLPTRVAVFTNLFRDQLDRYGEVDSVLARWRQAIAALGPETTLVLNADDPTVANLGRTFAGQVIYFGIACSPCELAGQESPHARHQVVDSRLCPDCGHEYTYTRRFYSHIGHYQCPGCGQGRPRVDVLASCVQTRSFDRLHVQVELADGRQDELLVPLPGLYNVYNALAAAAAARALEIAWEPIASGIGQYKPAFGRGERVQTEGRTIRMLLAKNPTGLNEVLRTVFTDGSQRHLLLVLNDNVADGRDISWIWDVDFEQALPGFASLTIAGTRARDLALRLKYAGVAVQQMTIAPSIPLRTERQRRRSAAPGPQPAIADASEPVRPAGAAGRVYGIAGALDQAISQTPEGETLFVVPTYTGLLEVHRELERRGLTPHYWEETGP
ncbi:MAG TPA: MurT ligase domain-containing protein [Ktedonobacteraceae bacterium]